MVSNVTVEDMVTAAKTAQVDKARRCLNQDVAKFVCEWGGSVITLKEILYCVPEFRENRVHPWKWGVDIFLADIREEVVCYLVIWLWVRRRQKSSFWLLLLANVQCRSPFHRGPVP